MDIAETKQYMCPKHPGFQVEFMQVNNLRANKKYQKLFYCSGCIDQDSHFKQSNYQLIKNIIQSSNNLVHTKWPPVNDNTLLQRLMEITIGEEDMISIEAEIQKYFDDLKCDIMKQIDICQKKVFEQVHELSQKKEEIIQKYQTLSKMNELKTILMNNETDIHQKEKEYRILLENISLENKSITEQLESLIEHHKQQHVVFYSKSAHEIKEQILKSINSISSFQSDNNLSENPNNNQMQLDVSLFTTNLHNGNKNTEIYKDTNNQYTITIKKENDWLYNIVSNQILNYETKYIFRFKIYTREVEEENEEEEQQEQQEEDQEKQYYCCIGLIHDSNINNKCGLMNNLSCILHINKGIIHDPNYEYISGIDKLVKGNKFILSESNEIEMRVCIRDQILEVLDYPHYHSKLVLQDQYKSRLTKNKKLRLYLGMHLKNHKIVFKKTFTVQKFE